MRAPGSVARRLRGDRGARDLARGRRQSRGEPGLRREHHRPPRTRRACGAQGTRTGAAHHARALGRPHPALERRLPRARVEHLPALPRAAGHPRVLSGPCRLGVADAARPLRRDRLVRSRPARLGVQRRQAHRRAARPHAAIRIGHRREGLRRSSSRRTALQAESSITRARCCPLPPSFAPHRRRGPHGVNSRRSGQCRQAPVEVRHGQGARGHHTNDTRSPNSPETRGHGRVSPIDPELSSQHRHPGEAEMLRTRGRSGGVCLRPVPAPRARRSRSGCRGQAHHMGRVVETDWALTAARGRPVRRSGLRRTHRRHSPATPQLRRPTACHGIGPSGR